MAPPRRAKGDRMQLTLNGRRVTCLGQADGASLLEVLRDRLRLALDEGRLRARRVVRRLHGDRRRPAPSSRALSRRRASRGATVAALEGLSGRRSERRGQMPSSRRCRAVRLLHPGHRDEGRGTAAPREPEPTRPGRRPGAGRQPVPLHRLRERSSRPSSWSPQRRRGARRTADCRRWRGRRRGWQPRARATSGQVQVLGEQSVRRRHDRARACSTARCASPTIRGRWSRASTSAPRRMPRRGGRRHLARRARRALQRADQRRLAGAGGRRRDDPLRR